MSQIRRTTIKHLPTLPLSFEGKSEQFDQGVRFFARADGYDVCLTASEAVIWPRDSKEPDSSPLRMSLAAKADTPAIRQPDVGGRTRAVDAYGRLPLRFEANRGQAGAQAKFISRNSGFTLALAADGAAIHLRGAEEAKRPVTVRMKFVNADAETRIAGMDSIPGVSNYFVGGDSKRWGTGVANFGKVKQQAICPGIDAVWYGAGRQLEHDFVIAPGANPRKIKLAFSGAADTGGLSIDAEGSLELRTEAGDLRLLRPVAWQISAIRRTPLRICSP